MEIQLYAFISVIVVSAVSLIGAAAFLLRKNLLKEYIFLLVSLAIGALLGDAFFHIIPESVNNIFIGAKFTGILVIAGVLMFFCLEQLLHWHHHHGKEKEGCRHSRTHPDPVGNLILISDGVHNFLDGFIIGAAYLTNLSVGIATALTIILHEIPQEIADFGILVHSGYSEKKALALNFASALTAVIGTMAALILNGSLPAMISWSLPLAAGGFIYIALSDLIPELHKKSQTLQHSLIQIIIITAGLWLIYALA